MPQSFARRFAAARTAQGPLVFGLDPSAGLLEAWGLGDSADGLDRFADIVLEAAAGPVGLVKPQSAFYERHGWRGIRTLDRLIEGARSAGLLVILDVKRGDVGSTNDAYAEAYLGKGAPLGADAITVHPYLGLGAMGTFVSRAAESGSCLLVVTRSSNREGRPVQAARVLGAQVQAGQVQAGRASGDAGGEPTVEQDLLREIGALNARLAPGELGPVGAVIGPTYMQPELDLAAAQCLFLAPGVGAQGATPADVARVFAACPDRVMPSASRSLLAAGPDVSRLRYALTALAAEFRAALPCRARMGAEPLSGGQQQLRTHDLTYEE
ncbi:MAG TPA: orotidine-5'-phosphate decarboxylase [Streptosporangiaceae bacterium]|jgi:orotidine-5'-phosphate decarboxylase